MFVNLDEIKNRHDVETVLESLFHHCHLLARQDEGGVRTDEAKALWTLASRLRATLDRTPEYYAHAKAEGLPIARFPYEPGEVTTE